MNKKITLFTILLILNIGHGPAMSVDALGSTMGTEVIILEKDNDADDLIDVLFVGAEFDVQENINLDIYVNFYINDTYNWLFDYSNHFDIDVMGTQEISVEIKGSNLYDLNFTGDIKIEVVSFIAAADGSDSDWFYTDSQYYYFNYLNFELPPLVLNSYSIYFEDIYDYDTQSTGTDGLYDAIVVEFDFTSSMDAIINLWGSVSSTSWYNDNWYDDFANYYWDNTVTTGTNIISLYFAPGDLFNMSDSVDLRFDIDYELYEVDNEGYWDQLYYNHIEFYSNVNGYEFAPPVYQITSSIDVEYVDSDSNGLFDQIDISFGIMTQIEFRLNLWINIYHEDNEGYRDYLVHSYDDQEISSGLQLLTLNFDSVYLGQIDDLDNLFIQFGGEITYYDDQLSYYLSLEDISLGVSTDEFDLAPVYFDLDSLVIEGRNYNETTHEAPFDYLYTSIILVVDQAAQVDTWFSLNVMDSYRFDSGYHDYYEIGTYTVEFGISGSELYNTYTSGDAWYYLNGHAYSDTFDFELIGLDDDIFFDSNDFKPDGEYTDTKNPDYYDDQTDDGEDGPSLDLPAPSIYLGIITLAALVIIRKKK